jgi:hypothetical protein
MDGGRTLLRLGLAASLFLAPSASASIAPQSPTVLYDGALNTPPEAQGFVFADLPPGSATRTTAGGATTLDTTASNTISAGYTVSPTVAPGLDRFAGYSVLFTVQLITETHANNNRAGFSLIALSSDTLGIELGFWTGRVWAQEGGSPPSLFTQAEGVMVATTSLMTYTLTVDGNRYTLFTEGQPLLSGVLRDYGAFVPPPGLPNPYTAPNFIFLGDNTTSARGSVRFAYVAVTTPLNKTYLPLALK